MWGETHGVAIDESGLIYIKHRSTAAEPMDAIVVFDPDGKFVRSFGKEYHGGGHGIDIRKEGGPGVSVPVRREKPPRGQGYAHRRATLEDELSEHGVYQKLEQFNPTNVAFAPDGGFYVADGYGSSYIHQYDANAKWVRTWGGAGTEDGKMRTPHGIWLDNRPGRRALAGRGRSSQREAPILYARWQIPEYR